MGYRRGMSWLRRFSLAACLLSASCQSDETDAGTDRADVSACAPLASQSERVTLGEVLGAGQSAEGIVYVVDRVEQSQRVLIAEGQELVLQQVAGTGESNDETGSLLSFALTGREPPLFVELWQGRDGTRRMGVLEGELPRGAKEFAIGEAGEELTLVSEAELSGYSLRAETLTPVVEYAARVAGERFLIVLRPEHLETYEQFRVFYGSLDYLAERRVDDVSRALDGGSTFIDFEVDGETAQASFPIESENDMFQRGAPSLTLGKSELAIDFLPEDAPPPDAQYYCSRGY